MSVRSFALFFSTAVITTFGGGVTDAQTLIDQGGFSTGQTLVDFNANDYAGSGVTFSGALPAMTHFSDASLYAGNRGVVITGSRQPPQANSLGLAFSSQLTVPQTRMGFDRENWPQQTLHSELFNGVNDLGRIDFPTSSLATAGFVGFQDFPGFDRKLFTNTAENNELVAFDNFELENDESDSLQVPALIALLGLGGTGLAIAVIRRWKAI